MTSLLVSACRAWFGVLRTERSTIGPFGRVWRTLLFVPVFTVLYAWLRMHAAMRGPLVLEGRTPEGVTLECRLPDLIQMYVHLFGVWEPDHTELFKRRVRPGDVVLDVGANVGCFTALFGRRVGAEGKVVACEASPLVASMLRDTLRRSGVTDVVEVVEAAVSDRKEELPLFAGPDNNLGLTATVEHRGLAQQGSVQANALPELVAPDDLSQARLIKIDVEGAEDRVLAGLVPAIDRLDPDVWIVVELSPEWWADTTQTPLDVLRPWLDAGYNVYEVPNSYWPWRYLWPRAVQPPQRLRALDRLGARVARLDLVLARQDAENL